jgi:hypothetical protein
MTLTKKKSPKAFALAATTAMTAISMTLAAVMLSARAQWQLYTSRSAEKNILEAAATAETQDFMHRVKRELESKEGSDPRQAGILAESELFLNDPFRRVELRGGVARTLTDGLPSDRAPLLYKKMSTSSLVSATATQTNMEDDPLTRKSIQLPSIWVPADTSSDSSKNPAKLPLGKDDPFYNIQCRTSMAAIAAYSESRRSVGQGGVRGFGNVVSVQTRTFPASAFTYLQFDPADEITLSPPHAWHLNEGSSPSSAFDLGRIYTPGKVKIDSASTLLSSGIVALRGVESTASPVLPFLGEDLQPPSDDEDMEEWLEELEDALESRINEANKEYEDELEEGEVGKLKDEIAHSLAEKHGNNHTLDRIIEVYQANVVADEIMVLNKDVREKLKAYSDKLLPIVRKREDAIIAAQQAFIASKNQYYPQNPGAGSGGSSGNHDAKSSSGNRAANRRIELVRSLSEKAQENPEKVRASLDEMGDIWNKERVNSFRGTLVTSDNGGTSLVRNAATKTISGLIEEMSKYVDCSATFGLGPADPTTGWRNPIFMDGGLKLKVNTSKPTSASLSWLAEGDKGESVFYWERNEDGTSGMLVFDPSRLKFSSSVDATRPFSIFIDATRVPSAWPLFVKTSGVAEGITIISKGPIHVIGDFNSAPPATATGDEEISNMPSMIVAPEVYACTTSASPSGATSKIQATVITRAKDSTSLFRKPEWAARSLYYPPPSSSVRVEGSSIAWENDDSSTSWVHTSATPWSVGMLEAGSAPVLVPVVGEVRVSAGSPTTDRVMFTP